MLGFYRLWWWLDELRCGWGRMTWRHTVIVDRLLWDLARGLLWHVTWVMGGIHIVARVRRLLLMGMVVMQRRGLDVVVVRWLPLLHLGRKWGVVVLWGRSWNDVVALWNSL